MKFIIESDEDNAIAIAILSRLIFGDKKDIDDNSDLIEKGVSDLEGAIHTFEERYRNELKS